jgi:hypothetical protein
MWLALVNMVMTLLISMNAQWQMKILGLELQTMVQGGGAALPHIYKVMCKCSGVRKACREMSNVYIKPLTKCFDMAKTTDLLTHLLIDKQYYHTQLTKLTTYF